MNTGTTKETLERLKNNFENYDPNQWDVSKEELENDYVIAKHISETLDILELKLLSYLRAIGNNDLLFRIIRIAKNYLNAKDEFRELKIHY